MVGERGDERKNRENIVQEVISLLGETGNNIIKTNQPLANCFMKFIFLYNNDETVEYCSMWEQLRDTRARNYWILQCFRRFGYSWTTCALRLTETEKTQAMASVLGRK